MKPTETLPAPDSARLQPQRTTGAPPGTPLLLPIERHSFQKRFDLGTRLGQGGGGEVHRAFDVMLARSVAIKILPPPGQDADPALDEARAAAKLQHAGIAPVYEIGQCEDGRRWLAMREVRGRDLDDLIADVVEGHERPGRRLIDIYARVCEAMAYVHGEGVVHRDLKPSNIRIGLGGDVVVLDWGIAGKIGERRGRAGTRTYSAPEQFTGAPLDPRMDVYALGRILQRIVDLLPHDAEHAPLRGLAERAAAEEPERRPADASEVSAEVDRWLDGAPRRDEARRLVREARALAPEITRALDEARAHDAKAAALLDGVPDHAPLADKRAAWAEEDAAAQARDRARRARLEYERLLQEARRRSDELPAARRLLARYFRERVIEAELDRDLPTAQEYEARLRETDGDKAHAAFLEGTGSLSLTTDPPGAEVWCAPYVIRDRRLELGPERLLGRTPLVDAPLGRGSWRARLARPGFADAVYPVSIARCARWDGIPPGAGGPLPIPLIPDEGIGEGECYVPPGWFCSGGDDDAPDGLPRRRYWVDGFVMMRHPLTYRALFDDVGLLWQSGRQDRARAIAGCLTGDRRIPYLTVEERSDGFRLIPADPATPVLDWPALQLSWYAATAWAEWRAERDGLPWRLPHDIEWEKAARGVDGRKLPWGDYFDITWANVINCSPDPPSPQPVYAFPTDVSPYGLRGMAGNVRDWCHNRYLRNGLPAGIVRLDPTPKPGDAEHRVARGGGWGANRTMARSAGRFADPPDSAPYQVGVRLVRSWPASGHSAPSTTL